MATPPEALARRNIGEEDVGLPPMPIPRTMQRSPAGGARPVSALVTGSPTPSSPGGARGMPDRPATASPGSQRHKRRMAFSVSNTHRPGWTADSTEFSLTRPMTPRGGVPATYRPHSSTTYGNLDAGRVNSPSVRGEYGSRPASAMTTGRLSSTLTRRGSDLLDAPRTDTVVVRPALPYQVVFEEDEFDPNMRHVGVQSAATTWTRFFHGIGQNSTTGLKKGNPFYQYFDVYLDPDPMGSIHVGAKGAKGSGEIGTTKVERTEMDDFFRRSYERLYFVTGTEPSDVFVDVAHLGEDAKEGWPAVGKERENERLNLIEYTRYVSRLHPRSADDMKQLMRLQAGLLRHMQQELAESEQEVSNRVRGIEAKLKGDYGERMDRANAELSTAKLENSNLRQQLRDSEREVDDLRRKLLEMDQRLRGEINELMGTQQKLQTQLADALRTADSLSSQLQEVNAARESEGASAEEGLAALKAKLEAEAAARGKAMSDLKMQKASQAAREKELLSSLSALMVAGEVSLPTATCYLPASADVRTAQLPPLPDNRSQTYNVSVPADTTVHLPATGKGTPALRPGSKVLSKKLPDAPASADRVPGTVTKEMPSGATLKLPRAFWGGDGNMVDDDPEEYEDTGSQVGLPIGSVVTLAVTHRISRQASQDGDVLVEDRATGEKERGKADAESEEDTETPGKAEDGATSAVPASAAGVTLSSISYRLRAVTVPCGSLVILPDKVHPGVNRYSIQLPGLCVLKLPSSELLSKDELETDDLGNPVLDIVSATAAEVGQRFGVAEAEGHYALDLKPATVFMASGANMVELKLPEGSTVVMGPGEAGYSRGTDPVPAPADPLEPKVAALEEDLLRLRASMFPLELLRTRLRHLMECLGGLEDPQGANALSMGVLIEVFRAEAHRADGGVMAISREADAPKGGYIAFGAVGYSAKESDKGVTVVLQRRGGSTGAAGVILNTFDGSAAAGTDYNPVTNLAVEWADGDAADRELRLEFFDDNYYEGDESYFVSITDVIPNKETAFAIGMNDICEVTIIDDDNKAAPGEPMAWSDITLTSEMPWDKADVQRTLVHPPGLGKGRWIKAVQGKAKPMKPDNLRTFIKNMIQAKRNADVVDDESGARASMPEFYRFYIEYSYGMDQGPAKHASILRGLRYFYRTNADPFISICTSMIGFYDPAPNRIADLVCKLCAMLSTSLIAAEHNPTKFWSRFMHHLCLSPKEMRAIHSKLYATNAKAKHPALVLDPASERLKALQSLLMEKAGEVDGHLDEEMSTTLGEDEKPTILVTDFLVKTLQHAIAETVALRDELFQLVDSFGSMDPVKGVLTMYFDKFGELVALLDPLATEERKKSHFKKVLAMDHTIEYASKHYSRDPHRKKQAARRKAAGGEAHAEEAGSPGNDDGDERPADDGAVAVAVTESQKLQVKSWAQAEQMAVPAADVANLLFDEIDFVFGASHS